MLVLAVLWATPAAAITSWDCLRAVAVYPAFTVSLRDLPAAFLYRPLRGEHGASTGENLLVRARGYGRSELFLRRMGQAVDEVTARFNDAGALGDADVALVRRVLEQTLIPARVDVDVLGSDRPLPPPGTLRDRIFRRSMFARSTSGEDKTPQLDYIPSREARGGAFYDQALALAGQGRLFSTMIAGDSVSLSRWELRDGVPYCVHPEQGGLRRIQDEAFRVVAATLNDPGLTEFEIDRNLARAHYLLIHATPTRRGGATYAHSIIDAARRALTGYGYPRLREGVQLDFEPLFHTESDYVRRFVSGDFFER